MSNFPRGNLSPDDPGYYDTNSEMIYVPVGVFLAICPIIVGTRIWSRLGNGGHLGADDWTILVSLVSQSLKAYVKTSDELHVLTTLPKGFALASSGIMLAACHYGYGRHTYSLSSPDKYQAFKVCSQILVIYSPYLHGIISLIGYPLDVVLLPLPGDLQDLYQPNKGVNPSTLPENLQQYQVV